MPSNHLVLCHPLLLLPSTFPSIRVCSIESVLHIRWSKHWSFSFSISPSNEYSRLIYFRMDWLDLLAVQGTLKSLLQYPYLKASIHIFPSFFRLTFTHNHYFFHMKKNVANFTLSSLIIYISSPDSKLLNISSPGCLEFDIARNLHNRAK